MNKRNELKEIILEFENGILNLEEVLHKVNQIITIKIEEEDLVEYWSYTTLDNLIDSFLIEPIKDWKEINDDKAIILLDEIINNLENDFLLEKNTEALEKRYSKTKGTLLDWIFQEDIVKPVLLLEKLKKQ